MNIVAITGGIGAGKSEAVKVFSDLGVPIVDLDKIARQLTSAGSPIVHTIAQLFGDGFIHANGEMDRAKMRVHVFDNPRALSKLNSILHPAIYENAVVAFNQHKQAPYQVLDIPLLDSNSQYLEHIHHVLVIDCEENTQIQRVMERNQLSESEAKKIIASQISRSARNRLADTVVNNDGNLQELKDKIINFHKNYIKTCIVS